MRICKSCGTTLDDTFVLGNPCPHCQIKIVEEKCIEPSGFQKLRSLISTLSSVMGVIIVVALLASFVFGIFRAGAIIVHRGKELPVNDSYVALVEEMEKNLSLTDSELSRYEFEAFILNHTEQVEYLAQNSRFLSGVLFLSGDRTSGEAARFIVENKDKFKNEEVIELLRRIGYFP